jgi:hypothetical protein
MRLLFFRMAYRASLICPSGIFATVCATVAKTPLGDFLIYVSGHGTRINAFIQPESDLRTSKHHLSLKGLVR